MTTLKNREERDNTTKTQYIANTKKHEKKQ